jgi:hypothetical protein
LDTGLQSDSQSILTIFQYLLINNYSRPKTSCKDLPSRKSARCAASQPAQQFLSTLKEQAQLASESDEHLLVLIFGHSDLEFHRIFIGANSPRLDIKHVKRRLCPNTFATLFLTSCYSGGWLVQPCTNRETFQNPTGVSAAGPTRKSISWPFSRSLGRASGGTVATAIVQSLIAIEESDTAEREIRRHPTYISLAMSIFNRLLLLLLLHLLA